MLDYIAAQCSIIFSDYRMRRQIWMEFVVITNESTTCYNDN